MSSHSWEVYLHNVSSLRESSGSSISRLSTPTSVGLSSGNQVVCH
jgi:hypothetical protein